MKTVYAHGIRRNFLRAIFAIGMISAIPTTAGAKESGRLYSSYIRPGSGGGDVYFYLLSSQKTMENNSIVVQGKIREVLDYGRKQIRSDRVFTTECALPPQPNGEAGIIILYTGGNKPTDLAIVHPFAKDIALADQHHHDLWRAACNGDFSGAGN